MRETKRKVSRIGVANFQNKCGGDRPVKRDGEHGRFLRRAKPQISL